MARRTRRKSKLAPSQVVLNQEEGIRAAFYAPWDAASFSSLQDFARQIDLLYPDWLHVLTPDGRLQAVDDQTNKFFHVVHTPPPRRTTVRSARDPFMPLTQPAETPIELLPL